MSGQSTINESCYINTPSVFHLPTFQSDILENKNNTTGPALFINNYIKSLFIIYPNPNNGDVINIEFFNEGLFNDFHINILDINGRMIESRIINTESGLNKKEIILNNPLMKGMYLMQLKDGQYTISKKIKVF